MSLDFIAEMAWKSAAISGVALLALVLLRSRSAADRAAVVRLAVIMLLLLPVVSLGLPALQVEGPAPVVEAVAVEPAPLLPVEIEAEAAPAPASQPLTAAQTSEAPAQPTFEIPTALLLMLGYLTGVVLLGIRLVVGLWTLRRWTADAEPVTSMVWTGALRRAAAKAGLDKRVRLLASDDVRSPLSWGLRHPVILVDYDTMIRAEDADGVLAHEIAHVARRDWAMLMLSRVVVALFWFNPLVWLLERALVEQAEEAADLAAVGDVEPVSYARTLVACGAQAGGLFLPANSIAAGQGLARRVRAVLDESRRDTPSGSAWTGAAMLLCIAVSAPIAALELVAPEPPVAPIAPLAPAAAAAPRAPLAPTAPTAPPAPVAPVADEAADLADLEAAVERAAEVEAIAPARLAAMESAANAVARSVEVAAVAAQAVARAEAVTATAEATAARSVKVAAAANRAVVREAAIDVDDLIEMKVHGIDATYLAEMASIAPQLRLSVDQLVQTKVHGLSPARLREFAALGYGGSDLDDLIAMQIHGVTPTFVRDMANAGYRGLSTDDLVAMRIHGVSPDRARRAITTLGRRPSADELVKMTIHGVI